VRCPVVLVLLALPAACGDRVELPPSVEATSGTRIKLERYLYDDGTTQLDTSTYYDTKLHMRCVPALWADGVQRCVPLDAEAVFVDAECTEVQGIIRKSPERDPTVYIGYDTLEGQRLPARIYRAGEVTEHAATYYERVDGECAGPRLSPPEAVFVTTTAELAGTTVASVYDSEVGSGRLSLRVQTSDDGLFAPVELHDRTLDLPCTPALRDDGVACEPGDARIEPAYAFANPSCTVPAILVVDVGTVPSLGAAVDPATGCTTYRTVASELTGSTWQLVNGSCIETPIAPGERAFELAAPLELPVLDGTVEDAPASRRLAHVVLEDPSDPVLRFTSSTLLDRATRGECRRTLLGEDLRCLPAGLVASELVFGDASCAIPLPVARMPARSCKPISFATAFAEDGSGITLHAIGDPTTAYVMTGGGCVPYLPADGTVRSIGPALAPETFPAAQRYSER